MSSVHQTKFAAGYNREDIEEYRREATSLYYRLIDVFGDEKSTAKVIAKYYGSSINTAEAFLKSFSFRNRKSTQKFIMAGEKALKELQRGGIMATALLVASEDKSLLAIKEKAHFYHGMGIHIHAPQMLFDIKSEEFWQFLKSDLRYCDFVIKDEITISQEKNLLEILQDRNDIEICDSDDAQSITTSALQATYKHKFKREKNERKQSI